jgi:CO/xanthine dehydrogenase Mo-binding subunit
MAEVVMIAVVPAIVNAVAHATGHRFRELPLTPDKIKEALERNGTQRAGGAP